MIIFPNDSIHAKTVRKAMKAQGADLRVRPIEKLWVCITKYFLCFGLPSFPFYLLTRPAGARSRRRLEPSHSRSEAAAIFGRSYECLDHLSIHKISIELNFATGTDRRLTNKGTWAQSNDFAEESAISHDGSQVAYTWFVADKGRCEIRLLKLDTLAMSRPKTIFDNRDITWIDTF